MPGGGVHVNFACACGGRHGGVPLRGCRPYVLFMWSIHSAGQSWDAVSGMDGHDDVSAGSLSLCVHGHWVRFHCHCPHVPCLDLEARSVFCAVPMPVLTIVVQWHQRPRSCHIDGWWHWILCPMSGQGCITWGHGHRHTMQEVGEEERGQLE